MTYYRLLTPKALSLLTLEGEKEQIPQAGKMRTSIPSPAAQGKRGLVCALVQLLSHFLDSEMSSSHAQTKVQSW